MERSRNFNPKLRGTVCRLRFVNSFDAMRSITSPREKGALLLSATVQQVLTLISCNRTVVSESLSLSMSRFEASRVARVHGTTRTTLSNHFFEVRGRRRDISRITMADVVLWRYAHQTQLEDLGCEQDFHQNCH